MQAKKRSGRDEYAGAWRLADLKPPAKGAPAVFSTFACGGGSSIGYKLAGFDVVGANDIDPEMMAVYRANLERPGGIYLTCPVNEILGKATPEQMRTLKRLDILDGSPPCSTFSMAGLRDRAWGKKKMFREGQARQTLDMLFFDFTALAAELRPKVVVAENVKGMLGGKARPYVTAVVTSLQKAGYDVQVALLNAADHGTAQERERVFFVARRRDLKWRDLRWPERAGRVPVMDAVEGCVREGRTMLPPKSAMGKAIRSTPEGTSFSRANADATIYHSLYRNWFRRPSHTITSYNSVFHWSENGYMTAAEVARIGGFPDDYDYMEGKKRRDSKATYVVGMSVPPFLMRAVAGEIGRQWFGMGK